MMNNSIQSLRDWILQKGYSDDELSISPEIPTAVKVTPANGLGAMYVTTPDENTMELKVRIWNENQTEALFIWNGATSGRLIDAKVPPFATGSTDKEVNACFPDHDQLNSGAFWAEYATEFISKNRETVDKHLVKALKYTLRELIAESLNEVDGHGLIDRCLFASFLDHRNLWAPSISLAQALDDRNTKLVETIFDELAVRFNGDLSRAPRPKSLTPEVVEILGGLFGKECWYGNQLRLIPYRFDLINVELISSIFEAFIEATSLWSNNDSGAHYTPPQVAWRVVEQTIKPVVENKSEDELAQLKIIDPCCGSGVFLVHGYRYLQYAINQKRLKNNQEPLDIYESTQLVTHNMFGWDIEPAAVRIASFSLVMSLLDGLDSIPPDYKFPTLIGNTLITRDGLLNGQTSFNESSGKETLELPEELVEERDVFDVVIGNPPWGFKNFSKKYKDALKLRYPQPNKGNSSEAFAFKFLELAGEKGAVGVMLNSSVWANRTSTFRERVQNTRRLKKVIELGDVHSILGYSTSGENTSVLIFGSPQSDNSFEYIYPRSTLYSRAFEKILISDKQCSNINLPKLNELDSKYGINSLAFMKAGAKHQRLIKKIFSLHGDIRFLDAQKGGQIKKGSDISLPFKAKYLLELGYQDQKYSLIPESFLRRKAEKAQVFPVLLRRREIRGRMRCAVKQNDFTVLDDVVAIGSDHINEYAIAAIFSSKLAYYILRFLGRQFGQRDQSYIDDTAIKSFPLPSPEKKETKFLYEKIEQLSRQHDPNSSDILSLFGNNSNSYLGEIDTLIYELFGLSYYDVLLVESFFDMSTSKAGRTVAKDKYIEIVKDVTEIKDLFLHQFYGGMITSISTQKNPVSPPSDAIPSILAGNSFISWEGNDLTVFKPVDAYNWGAENAIEDAERLMNKKIVLEMRQAA